MCVCVSMWEYVFMTTGVCEGQKKVFDLEVCLDLELQVVVGCVTQVLANKLKSSIRAVHAHSHCAFPQPLQANF